MKKDEIQKEPRLGVDIGRVIIQGGDRAGDTAFFGNDEAAMLATPEIDAAVDTISRLVQAFDGRVWLVSKCGSRIQRHTLKWLDAHDFYDRTGVPADHVRFCRERADKRIHCVELGLTHFVDDRPDVHKAIYDVVDHCYLFGPQPKPAPAFVTLVATWDEAERQILTTMS